MADLILGNLSLLAAADDGPSGTGAVLTGQLLRARVSAELH